MTNDSGTFTFEFSLTILNHLGRQLYRNFITVIGEAVSNAWDANAQNVWINIDRDASRMTIRDDGDGMSDDGIQNRFLKIGYSKRKDPGVQATDRPFIGAKGIGKLALLSCADSVTVVSRAEGFPITGCVIDNQSLDDAIEEDRSSQEVQLERPPIEALQLIDEDGTGTALVFDGPRMSNSTDEFLRKALALFYRFSLIDPNFNIHYNDEVISVSDA